MKSICCIFVAAVLSVALLSPLSAAPLKPFIGPVIGSADNVAALAARAAAKETAERMAHQRVMQITAASAKPNISQSMKHFDLAKAPGKELKSRLAASTSIRSGVANRTPFPEYGSVIDGVPKRREALLDGMYDPKLRKATRELYKRSATIGDGGTADVLRYERSTGVLMSPKGHAQKAMNRSVQLEKSLAGGRLNDLDTFKASTMLKDLQKAMRDLPGLGK